MSKDLEQNVARIEERIEVFEQRLAVMERIFQTATGHDVSLGEDSAMLQALVVEIPGMSQTGVCRVARGRGAASGRRKALARASRCIQLTAVFPLRTCVRLARS